MRFSIRNKILISFSVIIFSGLLVLLIMSYKINEQNTLSIIRNDMIRAGNSLKLYLNQYIANRDIKLGKDTFENQTKAICDSLSTQIGNNVGLYDYNGNKLYNPLDLSDLSDKDILEATTGKIAYTVNNNGKKVIVNMSFPVDENGKLIGIIRYTRDYSRLNEYNIRFYNLMKIFVLIIFLLVIITSFIISKQIEKPVKALIKSTELISAGKYELDINIKSRDEIGELARRFKLMVGRISEQVGIIQKERDALKEEEAKNKTFFDNATHELKTPLTTIMGYAQIIKDNGFTDREFFDRGIEFIISESKRLNDMVVGILELSKSSSKSFHYDLSNVDLSGLIRQTCDEMQLKSRKYGIDIKSITEDDLFVVGDRNKLKEVLINLIDNSIKYGRVNSCIKVEAYRHLQELFIKVVDEGDGIPENYINKLFQPFYRIPGKPAKDKGSAGLGLSIVKKIVEGHGGTIRIESKINEGTVVTVSLKINIFQ